MEITEKTKVYSILKEYGDIAGIMNTFGLKRVGPYSLRKIITRFISVKMAARVHGISLETMLANLNEAIAKKK
jgi:Domain of unknown function (DUF1858)